MEPFACLDDILESEVSRKILSHIKEELKENTSFNEEDIYVKDGLSEDFLKTDSEQQQHLDNFTSCDVKEEDSMEATNFDEEICGYPLNEENDGIGEMKAGNEQKGRDRNSSEKELETHKLNKGGEQRKKSGDFENSLHQIKSKLPNQESNINVNRPGKKLFKCPECSYEISNKRVLKVHVLNHSDTKLFMCSECSYGTNDKSHFKRHVLAHSDTKLFKCSKCSYETSHKGDLKVHFLNHSDSKLYKCSECCYGTNKKSDLKRHGLNHSEMKLFKCTECSYETNHKSHLKRHILSHSNKKQHKPS